MFFVALTINGFEVSLHSLIATMRVLQCVGECMKVWWWLEKIFFYVFSCNWSLRKIIAQIFLKVYILNLRLVHKIQRILHMNWEVNICHYYCKVNHCADAFNQYWLWYRSYNSTQINHFLLPILEFLLPIYSI
jgi:hypothetical protein